MRMPPLRFGETVVNVGVEPASFALAERATWIGVLLPLLPTT